MRMISAPLLAIATMLGAAAYAAEQEPVHVLLNYPDGSIDRALMVSVVLQSQGYDIADVRAVDATSAQPTVRFFEPQLRSAAQTFGERLTVVLRDQQINAGPVNVQDATTSTNKPRANSLEVWLPR